ncbi:MAG: hypothetical protein IJA27_07370 [Lachnospiraceae bacterium]|nr:hypothetical protein [Lachnospiraceae bacterium]
MLRLDKYGKAWRDYLFAVSPYDAPERDLEDFITRVSIIDDSREEWMTSLFLLTEPNEEVIKECQEEITFQRDAIRPMLKEFSEYCIENGLEISQKELFIEDNLNLICMKGMESELLVIYRQWEPIAKAAKSVWERFCDSDSYEGLEYLQEDFFKSFMDEIYENRTVRDLILNKGKKQ